MPLEEGGVIIAVEEVVALAHLAHFQRGSLQHEHHRALRRDLGSRLLLLVGSYNALGHCKGRVRAARSRLAGHTRVVRACGRCAS